MNEPRHQRRFIGRIVRGNLYVLLAVAILCLLSSLAYQDPVPMLLLGSFALMHATYGVLIACVNHLRSRHRHAQQWWLVVTILLLASPTICSLTWSIAYHG